MEKWRVWLAGTEKPQVNENVLLVEVTALEFIKINQMKDLINAITKLRGKL